MSDIIQKKYEPTERAAQILSLAQEAFAGAAEVKKRTKLSVEAAKQCGQLMLDEQADVTKRLGKGTWESYFEITFSKSIPRSTAQSWMKLSRETCPIGQTKSANQPLVSSTPIADDNEIRKGMLALDLFPSKKHEPTPEAGPSIATPKLSTHLGLINRLIAWHSELMASNDGFLTQEHRSQLIKDFTPVLSMINDMRG